MFPAVRSKLFFFDIYSISSNYKRLRYFPSNFILNSDYGNFLYFRVLRKYVFDFPRINVFAR